METLNKSIHTPLSDGFSRCGIDGFAFIQRIHYNTAVLDAFLGCQ